MKNHIKFLCLFVIFFVLVGCTSSIGTTHLYRVDANKKLISPWETLNISHNRKDLIYKTSEEIKKDGSDIFSIFISDAYFRYLPDLGGVNEVIIVAEFSEADAENGEKLVKVLGPYKNIADHTKGPFFNKPIYGPKRLESDLLSMDIKIYEYDEEEANNNAAMLDFIADLGTSLSVANPVTVAEIALAKQVAKAINDTNKNDLIMHADISFIAGDHNLNWAINNQAEGILLKAGTLLFVKEEACQVSSCYGYFTNGDKGNPVALIVDSLMLLPVALNRGFTDSPDSYAMEAMENSLNNLYIGNYGITDNSTNQDHIYTDKTWLRMNIIKGGDPSKWETRKALWELDKDTQEQVKSAEPNFASLGQALDEAKNKVELINSPLTINTPLPYQGKTFFYSDNKAAFCLALSQDVTLVDIPRLMIGGSNIVVEVDISLDGVKCYELGILDQGEYQLGVDYLLNENLYTKWFPLLSILKPIITKTECLNKNEEKYKASGTHLNYINALGVDGIYTQVNSNNISTEIEFTSSGKNISKIYTPAGEFKVNSIPLLTCIEP